MNKRLVNWLKSPCGRGAVLRILIIMIVVVVLYILPGAISLGYQKLFPLSIEEKESHNAQLAMILEDFSTLCEAENVDVHVGEDKIELVFLGDECDLRVMLEKDLTVISSEFIDNRFFADSVKVLAIMIVAPPGAFVAAGLVLLLFAGIIDGLKYRKNNNKSKE